MFGVVDSDGEGEMIWFKTRHEIRQLRSDVADFRQMVRTHFDIKYTLDDFRQFTEDTEGKKIPTSVGEFLNYYKIISPSIRSNYQVRFRGYPLRPKANKEKEL